MAYMVPVSVLNGAALPHGRGIRDIEIGWFGGTAYAYAGTFGAGTMNRLSLAEGESAVREQTVAGNVTPGTTGLNALTLAEIEGTPFLLGAGRFSPRPLGWEIDPETGGLGTPQLLTGAAAVLDRWSQVKSFELDGQAMLAIGQTGGQELRLARIDANLNVVQTDVVGNGRKATLGDISDFELIEVDGTTFLLVASEGDDGLTSLRIDPDGTAEVVDFYGAAVGAGMTATSSLATAEVDGVSYVIAGSAMTSTLTVLRINHLGVLFETDHKMDTLQTRFGGVQDIAVFTHEGRSFVVAGGNDQGLSLFELGPGGRLYHLESITAQMGWTLDRITAISAEVVGDEAVILVAGEGAPGLTQFSVDMTRFGKLEVAGPGDSVIHGTPLDDHLEAGPGSSDVRLFGGAGDDRLVAGAGETQMWGGPGADVFVFSPGGGRDRINDFEPGIDKIDLSAYPMLYSMQGLTIEPTHNGARIRVGDDIIIVRNITNQPLTADDFSNSDFIFF